jgi:hypothetical protein
MLIASVLTLMMEAVIPSETLVSFYRNTRPNILEDMRTWNLPIPVLGSITENFKINHSGWLHTNGNKWRKTRQCPLRSVEERFVLSEVLRVVMLLMSFQVGDATWICRYILKFRINILPSWVLKTETICLSETLMSTCKSSQPHDPQQLRQLQTYVSPSA